MVKGSMPRPGRAGSPAAWVIVGLLGVIAAALLLEVGIGASSVHAQVGAGGKDSVFVVAGQVTPETYGLYLVDTTHQRICVYQWLQGTRKLRLMAVRNYTFDLRLDEYNTEKLPREIKKLVEQGRPLDGKRSDR